MVVVGQGKRKGSVREERWPGGLLWPAGKGKMRVRVAPVVGVV